MTGYIPKENVSRSLDVRSFSTYCVAWGTAAKRKNVAVDAVVFMLDSGTKPETPERSNEGPGLIDFSCIVFLHAQLILIT